jgi:hypothetical protein
MTWTEKDQRKAEERARELAEENEPDWRSPEATKARIDPRILNEGEKAHVKIRTKTVYACSACGSDDEHHTAYVVRTGRCVT